MFVYCKCYVLIELNFHVYKTSESKDWNVCHYWYFLNKGFKFQPNVCKRRHDLLMMIMNIKRADYYCIIIEVRKSEVVSLM